MDTPGRPACVGAPAPSHGLTCTPLHGEFGVEVHGVDLRDVRADHLYPQLRALFEEHSLLLLRDQHLDDATHLAFGALWGPVEIRPGPDAPASPVVDEMSNRRADGSIAAADDLRTIDLMGNQLWHTDSIFLAVPALANVLTARVVPTTGGETEFVSTRAAWDRLDPAVAADVADAVCWHRLAHSREGLSAELAQRHRDRFPDQAWRLVWPNPVNGRRALYLASHTFAVVGRAPEAGRALVAGLIEHCTAPEHVYTHRWHPGDVLVWDERATLHRGRPWPYDQERTLASICISATAADGVGAVTPAGPVPAPA